MIELIVGVVAAAWIRGSGVLVRNIYYLAKLSVKWTGYTVTFATCNLRLTRQK